MIYIRQDSLVYELLTFLACVGEFPYASIHLFGNKETWRKLIYKLSQPQTYSIPNCTQTISGRLLNTPGEKGLKTVRLNQKGVSILESVNPKAASYYARVYGKYNLSGAPERIDRNHRVAETVALFRTSGIETRPFELPQLQMTFFQKTVLDDPTFYPSHELKHVGNDQINKTGFSRITGMLFSPGGCYAIYNSRDYRMDWNGRGEGKVRLHLSSIARMNANVEEINSAMMLGTDYRIAKQTLGYLNKVRRAEMRFDRIYDHLHFIPMNSFGTRLIKLLSTPDWNEILQEILFDDHERAGAGATFCYDAIQNGEYVLSFLDSDIFRLNAYFEAVRYFKYRGSVICFPEQVPFLQDFLGPKISLRSVTMDMVEEAIFSEGSDTDE